MPEPVDKCPVCGDVLFEAYCKVRCANCTYFEDCSDIRIPQQQPERTRVTPEISDDRGNARE